MVRILGVSASLRNARFGAGGDRFIDELSGLASRAALVDYLGAQTQILLHDFFEKGRAEGRPFTELYYTLRKAKGDRGLSNSEAALGAGLWGALQSGADISYLGLANYFPPSGEIRDEEALRAAICNADGILLSGPVYFGDRGSLAQRFFEFLHADKACRRHIRKKLFAGISVGAKRNGGQETSLIYQIVDATNLNMLGVGNDHETTAQYGGTAVAGDVGEFPKDDYGLKTSISTGRRIAVATRMVEAGGTARLADPLRIGVWLLQDEESGHGREVIADICRQIEGRTEGVSFDLLDLTSQPVYPCIACDVCPIKVGPPDEYRCIITQKADVLKQHHKALIGHDAFLLAAYSPCERISIRSVYQAFIERTRYLRRDDYLIGDRLATPLVVSEIGANQNLHIRMLTSAIRHHTILHHPLIGFEQHGKLLNSDDLVGQGVLFAETARTITVGRLLHESSSRVALYNPVGYVVSSEKQKADLADGGVARAHEVRDQARQQQRKSRLAV